LIELTKEYAIDVTRHLLQKLNTDKSVMDVTEVENGGKMDKKEQGKKNRKSGADFERRVRKDLEEKGWIVDKWSNNVESYSASEGIALGFGAPITRQRLIPAKHKFRGPGIPMSMGTGFPDFICIKVHDLSYPQTYLIKFVESKSNGYLNKTEKEKCTWLQNQGFNIEVAKKIKIKNRIHIEYKEFKCKTQ